MDRLCKKFVKLVSLELESMRDELEMLITQLDERLARHEITDYVRNENLAVLRNETLGLEECLRGCADLSFDTQAEVAQSIDVLAERTKEQMRERLSSKGYVPALYPLLERRLAKVAAYLKLDEV